MEEVLLYILIIITAQVLSMYIYDRFVRGA